MAESNTPKRDPNQRFTPAELKSITLAISHLEEYVAGYIHIEFMRREGVVQPDTALDRFLETATTAILDGLYPADRKSGLLPVLRLVGCTTLANEIEAALDRRVGYSTFAKIQNTLRDKAIAHPRFNTKAMQPIADDFLQNLQNQEDIDAFCEAGYTVKQDTAAAFYWFREQYSELVEHATSIDPDEVLGRRT